MPRRPSSEMPKHERRHRGRAPFARSSSTRNILVTGARSGLGNAVHRALGGIAFVRGMQVDDPAIRAAAPFDAIIHCAVNAGKIRLDADGLRLHGRQLPADAAAGRHTSSQVRLRLDPRRLSADRPRGQRGRRRRSDAADRSLRLHQAVFRSLRPGARQQSPHPADDNPARPGHSSQHACCGR